MGGVSNFLPVMIVFMIVLIKKKHTEPIRTIGIMPEKTTIATKKKQ